MLNFSDFEYNCPICISLSFRIVLSKAFVTYGNFPILGGHCSENDLFLSVPKVREDLYLQGDLQSDEYIKVTAVQRVFQQKFSNLEFRIPPGSNSCILDVII